MQEVLRQFGKYRTNQAHDSRQHYWYDAYALTFLRLNGAAWWVNLLGLIWIFR
jgi:hypothetical protein